MRTYQPTRIELPLARTEVDEASAKLIKQVLDKIWGRMAYTGQAGMTANQEATVWNKLAEPKNLNLLKEIGVDKFTQGSTLSNILSGSLEEREKKRREEAKKEASAVIV